MEHAILVAGIALCLVSLALIALRDWVRLTTPSRRVEAEVVGYRTMRDKGRPTHAATLAFDAEGARHEITDEAYSLNPSPPLGTRVTLRYPVGRPDLARIPRPLTWLAVYALLIWLAGMLMAKLAGWLPATGGG